MKKLFKRLISAVTALTFAISILPLSVNAATIDNATFAAKIAQLQTIFKNGEYWNAYNACGYEGTGPNRCPVCTNKGMTYCDGGCADNCGQFYLSDGTWISGQCLGFACKIGNAIFGGGSPLTWSQHTNGANIKPGDIIYGNLTSVMDGAYKHAIFITAVSGNSITYADCNSGAPCRVNWGSTTTISAIQTATGRGAKIYHASNNATTTGSPSPSIEYSSITPGNYFIISQSDGKSLTLANNEDWNTNNIHMYETMWNNRGQHMEISQAPDGYKIRPIDSTRLVNPYGDYAAEGQNINIYTDVNDSSQWWKFEKVGEGYVIHNAQNPNLVIDNADSSEAKLWTFNNGSNQKWLLIPAVAPDAPVIKGVKSSYEQSEAIIVDWDATYNTDRYDIGVAKYENGDYKWMFWQGNVTPKFNVSAAAELGAGDYRMRLESVNTKISLGGGNVYLSTVGEYVYFSIKENAAAPTIRINNTSTAVGKQVKIPVYIDNAKISSLAFTVKFDPQVLKYVSVNEMAFGNYDVNTGSTSTGSVRLACFNEGSAVSGKIVVLNFEVIAKKACNTRVGIHNSEAYDNQDKAVTLKETEADISIGASSILGDVNNDGKTNIIDARWLLQAASGSRKLTEAQKAVADVNKDGKINVIDARWMLQVASGSRKL